MNWVTYTYGVKTEKYPELHGILFYLMSYFVVVLLLPNADHDFESQVVFYKTSDVNIRQNVMYWLTTNKVLNYFA